MIDDFLASWPLFADAWATALLLALLLPALGIVLLLRQQVFLAASIGQAASLGYALAIWAGIAVTDDGHGHAPLLLGAGWGAAVLTAFASLRALSRRGTEIEARAAVVFLLGGSAAMVLLADAPHGMHDVQRMFLSSLLGAERVDVAAAAILLVATAVAGAATARRLLLWAVDPVTAAAYGMSVLRWDLVVGVWLGSVLAFAIHTAGLVFAFGASILPVLLARESCRSLRAVAIVAPVAGAVLAFAGVFLGHVLDRPPGQMIVALQALAVVLARGLRSAAGSFAGRRWP